MKRGTPFELGNRAGHGRPKGSRNKATLDREALLDEYGAAITRKCLAEALKDEKSAMRLCIERMIPPARHEPVAFKLPPIRSASDLPRASAAVVKAAADGTLSVQDAEGFQRILQHHRQFLGHKNWRRASKHLSRRLGPEQFSSLFRRGRAVP